jgi:hypothetical protein
VVTRSGAVLARGEIAAAQGLGMVAERDDVLARWRSCDGIGRARVKARVRYLAMTHDAVLE